jgi:hypothetical protein
VIGARYQARIKLNDLGSVVPAGHKMRLALSTSYWPMVWPSPKAATLKIFGGALDLPLRPLQPTDAKLPSFAASESSAPEKPTIFNRGDLRIERIDRLGLEIGTQIKSHYHIEDDDPLTAVAEVRKIQTMSRDGWQIRTEQQLHLSSAADAFLLKANLRAFEGENEVCHREWNRLFPRDFL